jgi:predicted nucleic acid-binding protein
LARALAWRARTSVAISEALWFTYLLVYALDRREPEKRKRAREVLRRVGSAGTTAFPAQVLSEFANACLRKLDPRPDPETIRREVERLMLAFPVLPLTGPVVLEALRGVGEHMLSYYDAQIWAVARLGQVGVVLSEDFNPGAVLDGVSFANPLDPAFDLAALE